MSEYDVNQLKEKIAREKGLSAELAAWINGETEAEIRRDAAELVRIVGTQKRPYVAPLANLEDKAIPPKERAWREMLDDLRGEG